MMRYVVLIAMVLVLAVGGTAVADKYFCAGFDNDWNDDRNWKSASDCSGADAGVPTLADKVIILSGKTCNVDVDPASADHIVVESTAVLNVLTGNLLEIDGTISSTSTITGTINLEGADSELYFTTVDQSLSGTGKITGKNAAARISIIGTLRTLTSNITIEGMLIIFDGTFINSHIVDANRHGVLEIQTDDTEDDSDAVWRTSVAQGTGSGGPTLRLNGGPAFSPAVLVGDFEHNTGVIDVEDNHCTTGDLQWIGGDIDCTSGAMIEFDQSSCL